MPALQELISEKSASSPSESSSIDLISVTFVRSSPFESLYSSTFTQQRLPSTVSGPQPTAGSIGPPLSTSAHWYAFAWVLGDIEVQPLTSILIFKSQNIQRSRTPWTVSTSSTSRHSASCHPGGPGSSFLTSIFQVIYGSSPSFAHLLISAEVSKRSDRIGSWTTCFQDRLPTGAKAGGSGLGNSNNRAGNNRR